MVKLRIALTRCALLLLALCVARADKALAQFDPPRIAQVLHKRNEAGPAAEQIAPNYYRAWVKRCVNDSGGDLLPLRDG